MARPVCLVSGHPLLYPFFFILFNRRQDVYLVSGKSVCGADTDGRDRLTGQSQRQRTAGAFLRKPKYIRLAQPPLATGTARDRWRSRQNMASTRRVISLVPLRLWFHLMALRSRASPSGTTLISLGYTTLTNLSAADWYQYLPASLISATPDTLDMSTLFHRTQDRPWDGILTASHAFIMLL